MGISVIGITLIVEMIYHSRHEGIWAKGANRQGREAESEQQLRYGRSRSISPSFTT